MADPLHSPSLVMFFSDDNYIPCTMSSDNTNNVQVSDVFGYPVISRSLRSENKLFTVPFRSENTLFTVALAIQAGDLVREEQVGQVHLAARQRGGQRKVRNVETNMRQTNEAASGARTDQ